MALKDKWTDKIDGVDDVRSEHINDVAHGVIELEEKQKSEAEPNSTAVRGPFGQLKAADPIESNDSVNLKFFKEKASNAFVGEKSGNQIEINDFAFSPNFCSISVESKNLVPLVYHQNFNGKNPVTIRGIVFTTNEDGSITMNGTHDGTGDVSFFLVSSTTNPFVLPKGTYIGKTGLDYMGLECMTVDGKYGGFYPTTLEEETKFQYLYLSMQKYKINGKTFNGETVYPMLMRGTVIEDYTEPIEGGVDVLITSGIREINSKVGEDLSVQNVENGSVFQAQNPRVSLTAKYNRDINSVYEELKNAIISMGANV